MKKLKYEILFIILVMLVGMAAVTSNLVINGNTSIASNPDDFLVYFSDVLVNGTQDLSLVNNETSLVFNQEFSAVNQTVTITYDVTNASTNYDADVNITCTQSTEYLTITNSFDTTNNLGARQTKTGTLTITQSKSYTGTDLSQEISCTINASAVERTTQESGDVPLPSVNSYYVGREISIGDEKFNVISEDSDTVTMLAKYNIGEDGKQSMLQNIVGFLYPDSFEYAPGPKDIEISMDERTYITVLFSNYLSYLKSVYKIDVTINLITVRELGELGCIVPEDYGWGDAQGVDYYNCSESEYSDWLINGQFWWTRSAYPESGDIVWMLSDEGILCLENYDEDMYASTVRPIITISKSDLESFFNKKMISFTIDGISYQAEEGMYWSDWVNSSYNTDGFTIYEDELNFRVEPSYNWCFVNPYPGDDSVLEDGVDYTSRCETTRA